MKIIAHRGASQYAQENSFDAFHIALTHPIAGIEFDVHFINGQAIVIHDESMVRTHNIGLSLSDLQQRGLINSDTVLSSFNHRLLDDYQKAGLNTQYGGLIAHLPKDLAQYAVAGGFDIVAIDKDMVTPELVADAHRLDKQVWVYTVNDIEVAQRLANWKVDAIFSNDTLIMR